MVKFCGAEKIADLRHISTSTVHHTLVPVLPYIIYDHEQTILETSVISNMADNIYDEIEIEVRDDQPRQ